MMTAWGSGEKPLQLQICSFHRLYATDGICLTGGKISRIRWAGPIPEKSV